MGTRGVLYRFELWLLSSWEVGDKDPGTVNRGMALVDGYEDSDDDDDENG